MEVIKIISDGTSYGTRIFTASGHEVGGVASVEIDKIESCSVVSATVKFTGVCLGDVESAFCGPSENDNCELISDPLQDAITSTEIACRTAEGVTLDLLQEHLSNLLKMQIDSFVNASKNKKEIEVFQDKIEVSISEERADHILSMIVRGGFNVR